MAKPNDKPVLDEQTLAKLLEAAYVLQEHNRELQNAGLIPELKKNSLEAKEKPPVAPRRDTPQTQNAEPASKHDYSFTLAQIVETQHQIQVRHLELENAMALVTERLTSLAKAGGAAIAILNGKKAVYRAASGLMTLPAGTEIPLEKALCVCCLRTGHVLRCADVNPEFLVDGEECQRRGIQSLIAVPIYHNGEIAGGLELYYPSVHAFAEQDVHTCQLMAGLVTEAMARNEEATSRKSLATERAMMMEALEKLKPNLAALVDSVAPKGSALRAVGAAGSSHFCHECGHELVGEEQFCGKCGSPHSRNNGASGSQDSAASRLRVQEALKNAASVQPAHLNLSHESTHLNLDHDLSNKQPGGLIEEQLPNLFAELELPVEAADSKTTDSMGSAETVATELENSPKPGPAIQLQAGEEAADETSPETTALARTEPHLDWSSAASARNFLEQLAAERGGALTRFWNTRRGDIYLAIAVLLVACVIRWGIWSSHSVNATGTPNAAAAAHRKPAPDADLSLFDQMLIGLGLAEAPPPPENKGNPDTQVWVDLHTALYYCPGADLYGKTPKGKFTTQREAQLDQFEPAYRKACD